MNKEQKLYLYDLWGAKVISDQPLDLEDPDTKKKLLYAKVEVDRTDNITTKFIIMGGKLQAHPEFVEDFNDYIQKKGRYNWKDYYETDF